MLKAIHASGDLSASREESKAVVAKLKTMKLNATADAVETGIMETLSYMHFLRNHWGRISTINPQERIMKEIRRMIRVVGYFPNGEFGLMLTAARLRYIAHT